MTQRIYHLSQQGELDPMEEGPYDRELTLQKLVAEHRELLAGEQITPGVPRRWILIEREQGIPEFEGGSDRWSLDHFLIDQDAVPTLVETKLSGNPEIRRAVVGQMLDYAAHARHTLNVERVRRTFEESITSKGQDPTETLYELLRPDDDLDVEGFWRQVETNLKAANLRLLFVADAIPDPLVRVVEFLNEQMPGIEVLAVEIKQFKGDAGSTLVPRVIGRTSEAVGTTTRRSGSGQTFRHNEQSLIESFPDPQVQEAARRLFEVAHRHGAVFHGTNRSVTFRRRCAAWRAPLAVAWLYEPSAKGWGGEEGFHFGAGNFSPGFFEGLPQDLSKILEAWVSKFSGDTFASQVEVTGIKSYAITHQVAASNIDLLCERLGWVLRELAELEAVEE